MKNKIEIQFGEKKTFSHIKINLAVFFITINKIVSDAFNCIFQVISSKMI